MSRDARSQTNLDALKERVDELGRRVGDIERELRAHRPEVLAVRLRDIEDDVKGLASEMRSLRKAVIGFAITVAASAVAFAMTVILVWGGAS